MCSLLLLCVCVFQHACIATSLSVSLSATSSPTTVPRGQMSGQLDGTRGKPVFRLGSMVFATFNAHGLAARYKQENLMKDLCNRGVHLCCVQETKLQKDMDLIMARHRFITFKPECASYGLAFVVAPSLAPFVTKFWVVSDRVAVLSLRLPLASSGRLTLHLINCYGPTAALTKKDPTLLDAFYDTITKTLTSLRNAHSVILVAGDFNARLGWTKLDGESCMGSYGRGSRNDNGRALADFAETHNLLAANTCFQHQQKHRTTWEMITKDNKKVFNQIDFVLVPNDLRFALQESRSYAGLITDSDHRLVICRLDLKGLFVKWAAQKSVPNKRRAVCNLRAKEKVFCEKVAELLPPASSSVSVAASHSLNDSASGSASSPCLPDAPSRLVRLNDALKVAAESTVGFQDRKMQIASADVSDLSQRQKCLRGQMRSAKSPDELQRLRGERRDLLKLIHKRTRQAALERIDAQVAAIDSLKDGAQMFAAVQTLRAVDRSPLLLKDDEGKTIASAVDKASVVASFFQPLLHMPDCPSFAPFVGPPRPLSCPVTCAETSSAILKLKGNRAAGPDGMEAELYKYGGAVVARELTEIINDVFACHTPIPTSSGLICPLQKPGKPRGPCSSLRPITLLNVVRKILSLVTLARIRPKLEPSIGSYQSGFRPSRSTSEVLWTKRWLSSMVAVYVLKIFALGIDLSRAFDTVLRGKLMTSLEGEAPLTEDDLRLVRYLLADMELAIMCCGAILRGLTSNIGTPQGDGLSPFLFIYYLDRAFKASDAVVAASPLCAVPKLDIALGLPGLTAYADDADRMSTSASFLEARLDHDLQTFKAWNLHVNKDKTERYALTACSPSSDACVVCDVRCQSEAIQCDGCDSWTHYGCSGRR